MNLIKTILLLLIFIGYVHSQENSSYSKSILLSFKAGYHTEYDPRHHDHGFPGSIEYDIQMGFGVAKYAIVGFSYEFWQRSNYSYVNFANYHRTDNYKANAYRFYGQFRLPIGRYFGILTELTIGKYNISNLASNGEYIFFGINGGFDLRIHKNIFLTGEVSYYNGGNMDYGMKFLNFKFGPTLYYGFK